MNWLKTDIGFEAWRFDFVKAGGSLHIASMHPACPALLSCAPLQALACQGSVWRPALLQAYQSLCIWCSHCAACVKFTM